MSVRTLRQRRHVIDTQWDSFQAGAPLHANDRINADIIESWRRSARSIRPHTESPPLLDESTMDHHWQNSALRQATQAEHGNLAQLVDEGDMVAAIADTSGRLLWTTASNHMRTRAESVNFTQGGIWDESSAGTNAVGLSLTLRRPVTVFSSEHFLPTVHEWVCYAAPVFHPQTRECVGVLDMSTTWHHYTPMGQAAVAGIAQSIGSHLPCTAPRAELEIHALGHPHVHYQGKLLALSLRQLEIICLLAMNQQGLSLDQLHVRLYGDSAVSSSTLKSELSRLRSLLGGNIGSRPYRLTMPVWADFLQIWKTLEAKQTDESIGLYRGPLLATSVSPELEEWRACIDARMQQTLDSCDNTATLTYKAAIGQAGGGLIRERFVELSQ